MITITNLPRRVGKKLDTAVSILAALTHGCWIINYFWNCHVDKSNIIYLKIQYFPSQVFVIWVFIIFVLKISTFLKIILISVEAAKEVGVPPSQHWFAANELRPLCRCGTDLVVKVPLGTPVVRWEQAGGTNLAGVRFLIGPFSGT